MHDERRHESYWERGASAEDRIAAAPDGGATATLTLPARADVLIVGGGFLGTWLAWFLSRGQGAPHVVVVERDPHGTYGASTRNAGFLTCGNVSELLTDAAETSRAEALATLVERRRGLAIVERVLGESLPREGEGSVDFDPLDDERRAIADDANDALVRAGFTARFVERDARFAGAARPAIWNVGDRGTDPVVIHRELTRQIRAQGVSVFRGVAVQSLRDGRAELGSGAAIRYDRAFVCVNAFARTLDPHTRIEPGRGQIIVTSPVEAATEMRVLGFLRDGYDYFRFTHGRLVLGGGRDLFRDRERTLSLAPSEDLRGHLHATAVRIIGHDRFSIDAHWAGIMGFASGRHVAGETERAIDARTTELFACGGMGVALTPRIAEQAAERYLAAR